MMGTVRALCRRGAETPLMLAGPIVAQNTHLTTLAFQYNFGAINFQYFLGFPTHLALCSCVGYRKILHFRGYIFLSEGTWNTWNMKCISCPDPDPGGMFARRALGALPFY